MGPRNNRNKKIACKSLRRNLGVGADKNVGIENNPHRCQLRRGRTCVRASCSAASIPSVVVSGAS